MSRPEVAVLPVPEEHFVRPRRDLGATELWERSLTRSRERRARAVAGEPRRRTLLSEALLDLDAPPLVAVAPSSDRDLTSEDLWDLSGALARARRRAVAKPVLTQARTAGASLLVAAIAASAPMQGSAHSRSARNTVSSVDSRLLRFGSRGDDVVRLQQRLGVTADGVFGPRTRHAVRAFQARHGLTVDGIVGPETRAALARASAGGGFRTFTAPWVDNVQRKLGIPADGVFGPQTRAAVIAFQKRKGLTVDGIVGPETRAALARLGSRSGSSGGFRMFRAPWVDDVQRKLGIPADGVFGPQTRAAVIAFQRRKGLVVDGIVGPQTLAALGLSGSGGSGSSGGSGGGSGGSQPSSRAAAAVRAATSQIGDPYSWGGDGPSSWDCSGLTMWAYRQAGVSLPHSSRMQFGYGRSVGSSEIRAGDLVFFSTNGPGASHVGIATSSRSFVSATSHGVRIQSIFDSYWGSNYVGARRL